MNYFAIIQNHGPQVRRIRTKQALQKRLRGEFEKQRDDFFAGSEIIEFDPRYKVDDDELFVIHDFGLPECIADAIRKINQVDDLALTANTHIKAIFAVNLQSDPAGPLEVYFQGFMQRRLLVSGWTLLQTQDTYKRMRDPGLILDSSLVAVYHQGNSLYFRSYTLVSRFLNLTQHFDEATDVDIREVLDDNKFHVDDESVILDMADSVMRKRFMAVKASGILNIVKSKRAQTQANKFGLKIRISGGKIVFPVEKRDAKELLRFLMEGYYEGPLTGNTYITNSQRQV